MIFFGYSKKSLSAVQVITESEMSLFNDITLKSLIALTRNVYYKCNLDPSLMRDFANHQAQFAHALLSASVSGRSEGLILLNQQLNQMDISARSLDVQTKACTTNRGVPASQIIFYKLEKSLDSLDDSCKELAIVETTKLANYLIGQSHTIIQNQFEQLDKDFIELIDICE